MKRALQIAGVVLALFVGADRAGAETKEDKTRAFQQRLDRAARMLERHPQLRDVPQERRRQIVEFVAGNMLFALLHEMGHAHIAEMGLPVLGREEDAADSFAVVTMLKVGSAFTHDILIEAALGWFMSAYRDEKGGEQPAFYDEHGLDKQRAYQIICLMVGSDMDRFKDLATPIGMPTERQNSCVGDYSNATWSWDNVLKPHMRKDGQPKTPIQVVYGEGKGELMVFEQTFRAVQLLEMVASYASDRYVWRRPLTLEMQSCGNTGAYWDLSAAKLTLCYEMAAEFGQLFRQYASVIALPRFQEVEAVIPLVR
jgi:hypothetical protein